MRSTASPAALASPAGVGTWGGLGLALLSAAAFATSGTFAKPLLASGWSPAAAVIVRLGVAALILAVPAAVALRGRWGLLQERWRPIVLYGLFGGAMVQVAYFNAIRYIDIGIALLVEYLGVIWVVLWGWARTRRRPATLTLLGMLVAIAGLAVVLNPGDLAGVDPRGLAWACLAAFGMAVYFITSAETPGIPPVAFVSAGLGVGAVALTVAGLVGLMPLTASTADVVAFGGTWPWWLPLVELGLVAAALAYLLGFVAARSLGSTVASFVGLTEVVFAVAWAWLLLAELPTPVQLLGGVILLLGVAAVQAGTARPLPAENTLSRRGLRIGPPRTEGEAAED